ncbi:MAG: hypothetical protein ABW196_02930 [Solirubrobacterales bacterium]
MLNSRTMTLLIAALSVVVLAAGCGGDDDTDTTSAAGNSSAGAESGSSPAGDVQSGNGQSGDSSTASLSREEFIAQAGAACAKESKNLLTEINSYFVSRQSKGLPEKALIAKTIKATLGPVVEAEIAAIRQLDAPVEDKDQIEAMLSAQEAGLERMKKLKQASDLGDAEDLFDDATRMLEAYGLEGCTAGL